MAKKKTEIEDPKSVEGETELPAAEPPAAEPAIDEPIVPSPRTIRAPAPAQEADPMESFLLELRLRPLGIDPRQLSFTMGVPLTAVHTAFNRLEAEGAIVKSNRLGAQLVSLTPVGALRANDAFMVVQRRLAGK
jgi:hypothetical protein